MKAATLIGILLIVLGIGALAYQGFSYKIREEILDIGPIEATAETTETIPVPPIVGALALSTLRDRLDALGHERASVTSRVPCALFP